ncbi:MAG: M48 family metallopeptidase [Thaumarchaeota archaeon]|nr:M48 family metallopeptidase [Nitrososphaerota archaeon]
MEVFCGHCGVINRSDRVFCLRCRRRLFPISKFDLNADDFLYPGDKMNLSIVEDAGWLPGVLASVRLGGHEKSLRESLSRQAVRVANLSDLDLCMRGCGDRLGLEVLPEAFVIPSAVLNAAVTGTERSPLLVVTQVALQVLSAAEMEMLIGHELAHIKSRHMLYHTAAESITTGGSLLASFLGAGLIVYPIQMSLLAWHRESEISADRAAILLGGDLNAFESMLTKTLLHNGGEVTGDAISQLFRTHPEHARRLSLAREFYASRDFARGREKLRQRKELAKTLIPFCGFCGSRKLVRANYCGSCGKSLV